MRTILVSSLLLLAFGRFEASIKFPQGDGIVGAYFLWKAGSEVAGTFWNELDFEKVGADCQLESNAFYGNPAAVHAKRHTPATLLCGTYHTYAFEWTPTYLAWVVDGVELRRDGERGCRHAVSVQPLAGRRFVRRELRPQHPTGLRGDRLGSVLVVRERQVHGRVA
jgi:hypothetical protein